MANTVVLLKPILLVLIVGLNAWAVVVAGSSIPWSVDRLTVATARLTTVSTMLDSAWSSPSNDFLFLSFPLLLLMS